MDIETYIDGLAIAIDIVMDYLVEDGIADRAVDTVPDTIRQLRNQWEDIILDEWRDGQDGQAFLEVVEATDDDLSSAFAVLALNGDRTDQSYAQTVQMVADDVRAGSDDPLDNLEAIAVARDTVTLPEAGYVPGGYPLDENGSDLAIAYRVVLEADQGPLVGPVPTPYVQDAGTILNSVKGTVYVQGTTTIDTIQSGIADYELDWIQLEVVGLNAIGFVYASEDSTDVVGMLAYLNGFAVDATGFGGLIVQAFAFGTDRLS